jgi:hypothetical protein
MSTSERLKIVRAERKAAQKELREQRELKAEKELAYQAELELVRFKQSAAEKKDILDRAERRFDSKYRMGH